MRSRSGDHRGALPLGVERTLVVMPPITGRDRLQLTRHRNVVLGDDRALRRAAARGIYTRLRIGAYVSTDVWRALPREDRHRLAAAAAAEMNPAFTATHRTAAVLWRMPLLGRGDGLVHTRATVAAGTRTEHGYRKHAVLDLDQHLTAVDGVTVTSVERTVVDLAMTEPFASAVVAADWALRNGATKETLRTALDELAPKQGRTRVLAVIAFADGRAASPGESWSRVQIEASGLPVPVLQHRFDDRLGLIGFVDFFWPDHDLIGEFDGLEKYLKPELLGDRTPSEVVVAEKAREDRLRATAGRPVVSRWIWRTLTERGALADQLEAAGLPRLRRVAGASG